LLSSHHPLWHHKLLHHCDGITRCWARAMLPSGALTTRQSHNKNNCTMISAAFMLQPTGSEQQWAPAWPKPNHLHKMRQNPISTKTATAVATTAAVPPCNSFKQPASITSGGRWGIPQRVSTPRWCWVHQHCCHIAAPAPALSCRWRAILTRQDNLVIFSPTIVPEQLKTRQTAF